MRALCPPMSMGAVLPVQVTASHLLHPTICCSLTPFPSSPHPVHLTLSVPRACGLMALCEMCGHSPQHIKGWLLCLFSSLRRYQSLISESIALETMPGAQLLLNQCLLNL